MLQNLLLTNRIQAQTAQNTLLPVISTVRNYWCEVVQEYQQADGKIIYEDPEKTQFRLRRADQAEGMSLSVAFASKLRSVFGSVWILANIAQRLTYFIELNFNIPKESTDAGLSTSIMKNHG